MLRCGVLLRQAGSSPAEDASWPWLLCRGGDDAAGRVSIYISSLGLPRGEKVANQNQHLKSKSTSDIKGLKLVSQIWQLCHT